MSLFRVYESDARSISLEVLAGQEDISVNKYSKDLDMCYQEGMPGIIWFNGNRRREFEVLDYQWSGPRYQDVMIQDNSSNTKTKTKRKGRVAGALIGTVLLPGIGTVIGAAVGTGRKEDSDTRGQTISHIETKEVPVTAHMKLRDLYNDELIHISFKCTSQIDARIRNNIAANLEAIDTYVIDGERSLPEPEEAKEEPAYIETKAADTTDVVSKLRELKQLLDDGVITREEFDALKKKII